MKTLEEVQKTIERFKDEKSQWEAIANNTSYDHVRRSNANKQIDEIDIKLRVLNWVKS